MDTIAIIINKKARNFTNYRSYLKTFKRHGILYKLYLADPTMLNKIVKKCVARHSVILVGGGDGTIRSAAQYCINTSVLLGVLPLGTLNHFCKELHLPTDADTLVKALQQKDYMLVDAVDVNGQIFMNNSSIGFYPAFAKRRDQYTRFYNKWLAYIPGFFQTFRHHKKYKIIVKSNKINFEIKTAFFMISNNMYSYKFPVTFERKKFNKAELGIYYFKQGKLQFWKMLRTLFSNDNNFEIKKTKYPVELTIAHANQKKLTISLDGETMMVDNPLKYQILPAALKILIKKS